MDPNILAAAVAGIPSVIAAVFAYRTSTQANEATASAADEINRIASTKVDGEAYERSQLFYEKMISASEKEIGRLTTQIDRCNAQVDQLKLTITEEHETNSTLRGQLRTVQQQVRSLENIIALQRSMQPRDDGEPGPVQNSRDPR